MVKPSTIITFVHVGPMLVDLHYILCLVKPQIHVGIKSSAGVTIEATLKYSHQLVQSHNVTQLQSLYIDQGQQS